MNAGTKLGAYGLVLAAALGGGATLGGAAGPIDVDDASGHDQHSPAPSTPGHPSHSPDPSAPSVGGLSVAEAGHRFVPEDRLADPGEFAFTILGPDGEPVTAFDVEHDKQLHLVLASRDLQQYAHLHPTMDASGRWTARFPDLPAGAYRAFADFRPSGGTALTLGVDLIRPGTVRAPSPLTASHDDETDGYQVDLDGDPRPGSAATLTVTVRRGDETVVTDPYLGARGHLVALRDGDLAYLHVHPLDAQGDGAVRFMVEVPSAGTYALYFDFAHDGAVHTARFVVDTTIQPQAAPMSADDHAGGDADHGH